LIYCFGIEFLAVVVIWDVAVDSKDNVGVNIDKTITRKMPKKPKRWLSANVDEKVMEKALKKKVIPRKKSVISKEREEDVAK